MANPKKILFVLPSLAPGGIEKHFIRQLRYFNRAEFKIYLATLFYYPEKSNLYKELPEDVKYEIFHFKGYFDISNLIKFIRFIKFIQPDVVLSSMFSANTLTRLLSLFFNFKTIAREHNIYSEKKSWQMWIDKALSEVSYKVVPVSEDVGRFIMDKEKINPTKVHVISNGIDIDEVQTKLQNTDKEIVRRDLSMGKEEKLMLNVARLKEQKNHELLIKTFKEFSEQFPNYKLAIIGEGSERKNLEELIELLQMENKIYLLGYRADVFNFYASAESFVLSSRREGFPNVILEALACGLPVLTTSVPGVNEIIEEGSNGYIIKKEQDLLGKMIELASKSKEEMTQISRKAKESALKFDMKKNVINYENLIRQALNNK